MNPTETDPPAAPAVTPAARPLPLAYAPPEARPPVYFTGIVRQFVFALGVGLTAGGITSVWGGPYRWSDGGVNLVGFGAGFIALTLPFPGGLTWRARGGRS